MAKTNHHGPNDLPGGQAGPYLRGDKITRVDQVKPGMILIEDCTQFEATNVARVMEMPKEWHSLDWGINNFLMQFVDPADVMKQRMPGDFLICVWQHELTLGTRSLSLATQTKPPEAANMDCQDVCDPQWKHATTTSHKGTDQVAGIDLFDDEDDGQFTIYVRFKDGTRWPARTVSLDPPDHAQSVLDAWAADRGKVHDYRKNKSPVPTAH